MYVRALGTARDRLERVGDHHADEHDNWMKGIGQSAQENDEDAQQYLEVVKTEERGRKGAVQRYWPALTDEIDYDLDDADHRREEHEKANEGMEQENDVHV